MREKIEMIYCLPKKEAAKFDCCAQGVKSAAKIHILLYKTGKLCYDAIVERVRST